ncbi:MAG: hypothetical protein HMLKMBBP_03711 [Planctomycetes bacterium]|nr:hypothetical protein [Planctomycetota bacterium]
MTEQAGSLCLEFGETATTARLRAGSGHEDELRQLTSRFRTARQVGHGVAEVELDDLLMNLAQLSVWPHPASVRWDESLAAVARDTTNDAAAVGSRITQSPAVGAEVAADDVVGLLGQNWKGDLTAFQRRDLAKLLSLRHGANFSVPGAGKTRVALAAFAAMRSAGTVRRLLIVGPKSAYEAWLTENAEVFEQPLRMEVLAGGPSPATDALIVNYERLDGSIGLLARWISAEPSLLVLDEAHRMKLGAKGTYGSACLALAPRARRRLILTGTPAPNGAADLENLLGFVWPGYGKQAVARAVSGGDLAHASRVLRPLFTRTTKRELGLPDVSPSIRFVELPPLHREVYQALTGLLSVRAAEARGDFEALGRIIMYLIMAATSPALLAVGGTRYEPLAYRVPPLAVPADEPLFRLMRDLPAYEMSPKYREAMAIVAQNAAAGRKTIVWSTFVRSLMTLREMLSEFAPALVHGGTPDRGEQIQRFRTDPRCLVLLSNPATLGEGISLHRTCHDAVYVDRDFAAGRFLQSLDRIHRLGLAPETVTTVTVIAAAGTIDDVVAQRLVQKLRFMGRILDDPEVQELGDLPEESSIGEGLDDDDLAALMGHLHARAS